MHAPLSAPETGLIPVAPGESVAAWTLSPVDATYYPGEPATSSDPQNYRYVNGFVAVGDLPCRVALRKEIATRTVELTTDWPVESLYLPGANRRVEFTQFRHRPTRLSRWCRNQIVPPGDGKYRFRLATCGGVNIWADGKLAVKFEPFTRNRLAETDVVLPLRTGGSEVIVLMEEMAERDTNWFFELTSLSDDTLHIRLPVAVPPRRSARLKSLADSVRPEGEFVSRRPLVLVFDAAAPEPVAIHARITPTSHAAGAILDRTVTLTPGAVCVEVASADELPDGYHQLELTLSLADAVVHRTIAFAVLRDLVPKVRPSSLADRKREALEHMAAHGELRIGTALAMLALSRPPDERFRAILEQTLTAIEERQDCSDFVLVPLLWAYAVWGHTFPPDLAARTEAATLGYRYWVDEPGNDVMWFWSENHALCFHTSQLLAGRLFSDRHFGNSGRTGAEQAALAAERLNKWFDAVEEEGLAEWNSAAYYPVDFIGLLTLVELAPAPLAERARRLCDQLFTMIALHTLGGVPAGTMGRAYDKELRAGPLTELAPFTTLAFGEGWYNTGVASLPMLAAGRYEPPADPMEYIAPEPGLALTAHYAQGHGEAAHVSLYKTANVQLSANLRARPGTHGHQQHVLDIRFASHPFARVWINHPGEDDPWGHQRPSFWAGNGAMPRTAMVGNVAMLLYDLGQAPRLPFTHAYVAAEGIDERRTAGPWLILRSGSGLAALRATCPLVAIEEGPGAGREYRAEGARTGWVVVLADGKSVDQFQEELGRSGLDFDALARRLDYRLADGTRLSLDYEKGLSIDGEPYAFPNPTVTPRVEISGT